MDFILAVYGVGLPVLEYYDIDQARTGTIDRQHSLRKNFMLFHQLILSY